MASHGSTGVVIAALAFNGLIAFSKFAAATLTGSSAMLSEAVHSLVDTGNQALLLHGIRRARKPPDDRFPFGYARELYFWSFIVAILLFSLGAGVSLYEGVEKLSNPHPITNPAVNYAVLGIAMLLEGGSTVYALREFNRQRGARSFLTALRSSKDPALFVVLLEDVAAMAGLITAMAGVLMADVGAYPQADGIASIVIGVILALVATFLSSEIKSLLIGEAASPTLQTGVAKLIGKHDGATGPIECVNEIRTMQLGPNDVLVAVSVDMKERASAHDVEHLTSRLESAVRQRFPEVSHFYLEVQSAERHRAFLKDRFAGRTTPHEIGDAGGAPTSSTPLVVEALRAVEEAPETAEAQRAEAARSGAVSPPPRRGDPARLPPHPHGTRKRGKPRR